jgi:NAD(P) transhydrogenase subunit beta
MNRSIINVILGGFGGDSSAAAAGGAGGAGDRAVKAGSADDAAFIMKNASKVIMCATPSIRWRAVCPVT